jgi:ankyrin repeat protein
MKARTVLMELMFLPLICAIAIPSPAQTANPQQTLSQYVADLQSNPNDTALRGKIIALAQSMNPAPAIPEDAERQMVRGQAAFKAATNESGFKEAIAEFKQASLLAPWLGNIYYNLGLVQDKAGEYSEAIANLNLYLLASPGASDAKSVKNLIYEVEYRRDKEQMGHFLLDAIVMKDRARALALIDKGADLNVKNDVLSGGSALWWAAYENFIDIVGPLLDKGADIEAKDGSVGETPLMVADDRGHLDVSRLLINRGANVNAKDNNGKTVLMSIICNLQTTSTAEGIPDIVRLLIDKGADVNAMDNYGHTALSCEKCCYGNSIRSSISSILRAAGAK